jgi:molybdenum cofactor cytidylyltransferase
MNVSVNVAGVILAAGSAKRFGSDKRQALLPTGVSLLETVLRTQTQVLPRVLVVSGPGDRFVADLCVVHGAQHVVCDEAHMGMGRSLAAGIAAVQAHDQAGTPCAAVLVGLADMPWVRPDTLHALLQAFAQTGQAVLPLHQGRMGQPRILPRQVWPALLTLRGDEGARQALDWSQAHRLPVDDAGVLMDADTPDDLVRYTVPQPSP